MDQHRRQLASALFTLITEKLEDAIPLATKGQDVRQTRKAYRRLCREIARISAELGELASVLKSLTEP